MKFCFLFKHNYIKILSPTIFNTLQPRSYHQNQWKITPTHLNSLLNTATQNKKCFKQATQIHTQIIINHYTTLPFLLCNLLNLYAKSGHFIQSLILFSNIEDCYKNVITWTSLITHLSHNNLPIKAITLFNQMRVSGVYPNQFTFSAILPACANLKDLFSGVQMHGLISKHGFDNHVFVGTGLVNMYAKCGDMLSAQKMFDEMPERNRVSWNSMIVGFLDNEKYDEALLGFKGVLCEKSIVPDEVTASSALTACANMNGGLDIGKEVHSVVFKRGLIASSYVQNSLMDMYCKCGSSEGAVILFTSFAEKDVVTWNVIITGFLQNNNFEEALKYFVIMRSQTILPDEASYSTAVNACAGLAALNQGTMIHNLIMKSGFEENMSLANTLISMYAKCGSLVDAHRVFRAVNDPNVVCWTAIISAFQQHGCSNQAIELFENMLQQGIRPDYRTFVCVLSACAHTGKVMEGFDYFNSVESVHRMKLGHEHYACMVDLLGRAGRLEEAKRFIESMPMDPGPSVWGALLGACRNRGNLEIGKEAAEKLFQIEPSNPGNYVILANIYTRNGKSEEADEIRRQMGVIGLRKEHGCSWIDVNNTTFVFTANDKSHSRTHEIYALLRKFKELLKKRGYVSETQFATNDTEQNKEQSLWLHSEKIALAFGLLALPVGAPIRIKKNLRTCGDCHTVMKYASEIFNREIIVRDVNRFHHFSGGCCSCKDYW
ncbi:putative pentatricopeptide repeat-containing protein At5g52630 [Chenopodium quinoa]|nr:putative pentatricopeptide repeat-containing protein At5g52630 [Chenopodium quinoa]